MTSPASSQSSTLTVRLDDPIGTISPLLHGHFAEHLGRCVYDGLWVGPESAIPNRGGWRSDVVEALHEVGVPLLRWPRGCFADSYHWRDGVGPASTRPRTFAESCGQRVVETNAAGTHEFIALCRAIGAEPYLAGNVGSGTPQELMEWVHYCNGASDTNLVRERAANGHPEPMNVKYWGVGNENWGCGGHYSAATYAQDYCRYATFVKQTDGAVEAVACGFDPAWNRILLETIGEHRLHLVDHLSIHRYWGAGRAETFTPDEYYRLLRGGELVDGDLAAADALIREVTGGKRKIGIALDEWGVWHPEAAGACDFEAPSTLRDAIAAAGVFDVLHRWCSAVSMANIAQIVNVLQALIQTQGDRMWKTPTYYAFLLNAPHRGAESLHLDWNGVPTQTIPASGHVRWPETMLSEEQLPLLSASASRREGAVAVTITNRHISEALPVTLRLTGASAPNGTATLRTLVGDAPEALNSADAPDRVIVREESVVVGDDGAVTLLLPAHSMATLVIE
jgi:alpha-N-arabinofuranosidase